MCRRSFFFDDIHTTLSMVYHDNFSVCILTIRLSENITQNYSYYLSFQGGKQHSSKRLNLKENCAHSIFLHIHFT